MKNFGKLKTYFLFYVTLHVSLMDVSVLGIIVPGGNCFMGHFFFFISFPNNPIIVIVSSEVVSGVVVL